MRDRTLCLLLLTCTHIRVEELKILPCSNVLREKQMYLFENCCVISLSERCYVLFDSVSLMNTLVCGRFYSTRITSNTPNNYEGGFLYKQTGRCYGFLINLNSLIS